MTKAHFVLRLLALDVFIAVVCCGTLATIDVTFFVAQQPHLTAQLSNTIGRVSDPKSPSFGDYLSHAQAVELQRPSIETIERVNDHIAAIGGAVTARSIAGDKIVATLPASLTREEIFPAAVHADIDFVDGPSTHLGKFPKTSSSPHKLQTRPITTLSSSPVPYTCLKDRVTAQCLRVSYGINGTFGSSKNNVGMAVIVNQYFKETDLAAFLRESGLPAQPITPDHIVGKLEKEAGDEATLDTQFITAMGSGVPAWWVYIDGEAANPFSNWLTWAANTTVIPYVHSLSVGAPEGEVGPSIVTRMNAEMMALGARGVSIIFASGDSGYKVQQNFGSSSPFVTSVGGVYNGELGMSKLEVDSLSSGGFSSMDANPIGAWQEKAVAAYIETKGERPRNFNSSRRCCPDLSIYDSGFYIIQDGNPSPIGGTSAAAPSFSGMIALLNDARLNAGKTPLGFLNPFLYANEEAFLDVTRGDNGGFAAVVGYDPASGLGTFGTDTFAKLKAAALALP